MLTTLPPLEKGYQLGWSDDDGEVTLTRPGVKSWEGKVMQFTRDWCWGRLVTVLAAIKAIQIDDDVKLVMCQWADLSMGGRE